MRRFFVVVLGGVFGTFLLLSLFVAYLLWSGSPEDIEVIEQSLRGGAHQARAELIALDGPDRAAAIDRLRGVFGHELAIVPTDEVPAAVRARWAEGHDPALSDTHLFTPLGAHEALALGPLPSFGLPAAERLLVAMLVALLVWAGVTGALLRPVFRASRRFEAAAQQMAEGDLSARIDARDVALARSARAFNVMAERLEALITRQRDLLAAVSHEFRTPLARLRFAGEMLGRVDADTRAQMLVDMEDDVEQLDQLVTELLAYVRLGNAEAPEAAPFELGESLARLVRRRAAQAEAAGIALRLDSAAPILCTAPARLFERAIDNLLGNALRYARGHIVLRVFPQGETVQVVVDDDGPGIAEADRDRVLSPFVRLNADGEGFGLGLAIVARILERHGGQIEIERAPSGGCRVSTVWHTGPVAKG